MLAAQRRQQIIDAIIADGATSITTLSERYNVSEMTIRRDLKLLEEEGALRRTHGGALRAGGSTVEPRYAAKQKVYAARKARIAQYAAEHFVAEGDTVLLEGGTTVTAMAQFLKASPGLTAVTNGLYTTNELRSLLPHTTVICTGGMLRDVSFTFVGPQPEAFLREFHAHTLFLSATGLTLEDGLTDPNMLEIQVKKVMVATARRVVILLDSSKFGVQSLAMVLRPESSHILITDQHAPQSMLQALRERGVDVRIVDTLRDND